MYCYFNEENAERTFPNKMSQDEIDSSMHENPRPTGRRQIPKLRRGMRSFSTLDANSLPQKYRGGQRIRENVKEVQSIERDAANCNSAAGRRTSDLTNDEVHIKSLAPTGKHGEVDPRSVDALENVQGREYSSRLAMSARYSSFGRKISPNDPPNSQKIDKPERGSMSAKILNSTNPFSEAMKKSSDLKYVAIREFIARRPDELRLRYGNI